MTLTTKGSLGFVSIVMMRVGLCGVTISVAVFVWIVRGSVRSLSNLATPLGFPLCSSIGKSIRLRSGLLEVQVLSQGLSLRRPK